MFHHGHRLVGNQAVEAMEAAEESTLLNLPVAGADFFIDEQKTASLLFFRPCDGSKVQKNHLTALSWHFFCIYFYFFGWRGEKTHARIGMACLGGHRRIGAPFVDQFGIRESRYVPFTHTLKLKSWVSFSGSGTSGVEKLYMSISLIEYLSIIGVLSKGIYSKINLKPGWKISSG